MDLKSDIFLGKLFDSYDEFIQAVRDHSEKSFSIWKTYNSHKTNDKNYKFVHLKYVYYRDESEITTKCNGTRPIQNYVAPLKCMAEIRVNFVTTGHVPNEEDFAKHPSNPKLTREEEIEINSKFETGSDPKLIASQMSLKTKKWLTTQDMWNVRMKFLYKTKNKNYHPMKDFENVMNDRIKLDNQNNFKLQNFTHGVLSESTNEKIVRTIWRNIVY